MPQPKRFTEAELKARKRAADAAYRAANRDKAQAWRDANKAVISEYNKAYRTTHSETTTAYMKQYRDENKEAIATYMRGYRKVYEWVNRVRIRERASKHRRESGYYASYAANNPDRVRMHRHNRRARKLAAGGKLSSDIVAKLMVLQRGRCAYCRRMLSRVGKHLDHVYPLARGGSNDDGNVQLLCPRCNCAKRHADPIEWAQRNGRLL